MVIRRVREHVASHNWFAVAVDLAIVAIGVFLLVSQFEYETATARYRG